MIIYKFGKLFFELFEIQKPLIYKARVELDTKKYPHSNIYIKVLLLFHRRLRSLDQILNFP